MFMQKKSMVVLGGIVVVLFLTGMYVFQSVKRQEVAVQTVKAEKAEGSGQNYFSGKLEALEVANIVSKVTGKVGAIYVNVGSEVTMGSTLLTLEANELEASVAQARANLEAVRSSLETARIDYDVQRENFERNKVLVEQGALARADFDNKYVLPFSKARETAFNGATAQVRQAEANLQLALANYQNSIIVSPINGVVTAKNVNIGELASPEMTMFSIVNLDKVFVMASIGEENINQFVVGSQVPVQIQAASSTPFAGTVTNIAQASGSASKTFLVKVLIDNPDHRLKPGMFAEILWEHQKGTEVVIPKTAIVEENGRNYVWKVKDGCVSRVEVSVGTVEVINVNVVKGIEDGEEIVISGQEFLRAGMPVTAFW